MGTSAGLALPPVSEAGRATVTLQMRSQEVRGHLIPSQPQGTAYVHQNRTPRPCKEHQIPHPEVSRPPRWSFQTVSLSSLVKWTRRCTRLARCLAQSKCSIKRKIPAGCCSSEIPSEPCTDPPCTSKPENVTVPLDCQATSHLPPGGLPGYPSSLYRNLFCPLRSHQFTLSRTQQVQNQRRCPPAPRCPRR